MPKISTTVFVAKVALILQQVTYIGVNIYKNILALRSVYSSYFCFYKARCHRKNGKEDNLISMWQKLLNDLQSGNIKALARSISLIENEQPGYESFLESLAGSHTSKIVGITGPPGAGKSTLTDALIGVLVSKGKQVAVLCVDPSSPFNFGAVLGDRIRMSNWYNHPQVFIRSLATRGALGGLHPKIIEITELVRSAAFDFILVETVGVGQSEVEIAGLADTTVVVLVPESGDEIQTMKAGIMEIADIFAVNKSDRPDADRFVANLNRMILPSSNHEHNDIPIIKTIANAGVGIMELCYAIEQNVLLRELSDKKIWLHTERAWQLIQRKRMDSLDKRILKKDVEKEMNGPNSFNLFRFANSYY